MKKFIILFMSLLVTGCMGANGVLESKCTKTNVYDDDIYNFTYFEGKITKVFYTRDFSIDVHTSLLSEKKMYGNSEGVTINVEGNKISYSFETDKISDEIKEKFNIKDTYNEQIKKLKDEGFTCD